MPNKCVPPNCFVGYKKNGDGNETDRISHKENNNNYLLNGDKVKLFSRDKTRDILFLERQREK